MALTGRSKEFFEQIKAFQSINDRICEILRQFYKIRSQNGHEYSARAYQNAIPVIEGLPDEITLETNLQILPGIGKKISLIVREYLETGIVQELAKSIEESNQEDLSKEIVLTHFLDIYGVGPKTANKWYLLGYRCLNDIPLDKCTRNQTIGVKYYHDLKKRIPREEIDQFKEILQSWLDQANQFYWKQEHGLTKDYHQNRWKDNPYIGMIICGSYRRKYPDSGDIDVLISHRFESDEKIFDYILRCPHPDGMPLFTDQLSRSWTSYGGICSIVGIARRVDIKIFASSDFPYAILYFTGSKEHNIMMRNEAIKKGYLLNEKGLIHRETGERIKAKTEKDIFKFLDLKYKKPLERNNLIVKKIEQPERIELVIEAMTEEEKLAIIEEKKAEWMNQVYVNFL